MLREKNSIEKREQDALFALGTNFFAQGQYRQAKVIFDGLRALLPQDESLARAVEECQNRFLSTRKLALRDNQN
jgi:cytochrome c-type biogenesis protein CcmH/NrfG